MIKGPFYAVLSNDDPYKEEKEGPTKSRPIRSEKP